MKVIFSNKLKSNKVSGLRDLVRDIGTGIGHLYDRSRIGWELGQQDQKPKWQQKMDALKNPYRRSYDEFGNSLETNPFFNPQVGQYYNVRAYGRNRIDRLNKQLSESGLQQYQVNINRTTPNDIQRIQDAIRAYKKNDKSGIYRLIQEGLLGKRNSSQNENQHRTSRQQQQGPWGQFNFTS